MLLMYAILTLVVTGITGIFPGTSNPRSHTGCALHYMLKYCVRHSSMRVLREKEALKTTARTELHFLYFFYLRTEEFVEYPFSLLNIKRG